MHERASHTHTHTHTHTQLLFLLTFFFLLLSSFFFFLLSSFFLSSFFFFRLSFSSSFVLSSFIRDERNQLRQTLLGMQGEISALQTQLVQLQERIDPLIRQHKVKAGPAGKRAAKAAAAVAESPAALSADAAAVSAKAQPRPVSQGEATPETARARALVLEGLEVAAPAAAAAPASPAARPPPAAASAMTPTTSELASENGEPLASPTRRLPIRKRSAPLSPGMVPTEPKRRKLRGSDGVV